MKRMILTTVLVLGIPHGSAAAQETVYPATDASEAVVIADATEVYWKDDAAEANDGDDIPGHETEADVDHNNPPAYPVDPSLHSGLLPPDAGIRPNPGVDLPSNTPLMPQSAPLPNPETLSPPATSEIIPPVSQPKGPTAAKNIQAPALPKTTLPAGVLPVPPTSSPGQPGTKDSVEDTPLVTPTLPAEAVAPTPSVPGSSTQKSAELLNYEKTMQDRLDEFAVELKALRIKIILLNATKQEVYRTYLSTADGNRSVAATKLKQLLASPPGDWIVLRTDIDKSFAELASSLERARSYLRFP